MLGLIHQDLPKFVLKFVFEKGPKKSQCQIHDMFLNHRTVGCRAVCAHRKWKEKLRTLSHECPKENLERVEHQTPNIKQNYLNSSEVLVLLQEVNAK